MFFFDKKCVNSVTFILVIPGSNYASQLVSYYTVITTIQYVAFLCCMALLGGSTIFFKDFDVSLKIKT